MQQCTTRINPSEETIKIGPLSIRFLVTSEGSHGSASVFEFRLRGATTVLHRRQEKLFGISKRGNIYLRRMLIHGARAVLFRVKYDTGGFGQWVHRLTQRAPRNKVVVAIANRLARMAWAVLSSGKDYQHQRLQMTAA